MTPRPAAIAIVVALGLPTPVRAQDPAPPPPSPAPEPTYVEPVPAYVEPPPPPRRRETKWSIRFNPIDLVWGKANLEIEYAFYGPLSAMVGPEYVFDDFRAKSAADIKGKGYGVFGQIGYWIDGVALRGYFIKAHFAYTSIKFTSNSSSLTVPQALVGAMFGSQSIHAGWFTLSWGIGVAYDLASQERTLSRNATPDDPTILYILPNTGPLENGVDLLTQLAIGGSF